MRLSNNQSVKDQRQLVFDKLANLVSVDSMTVHDAQHPQLWDLCEIFDCHIAVLVDFAHLRDEPCPCICRNNFDYVLLNLVLRHRLSSKMDYFVCGSLFSPPVSQLLPLATERSVVVQRKRHSGVHRSVLHFVTKRI